MADWVPEGCVDGRKMGGGGQKYRVWKWQGSGHLVYRKYEKDEW